MPLISSFILPSQEVLTPHIYCFQVPAGIYTSLGFCKVSASFEMAFRVFLEQPGNPAHAMPCINRGIVLNE